LLPVSHIRQPSRAELFSTASELPQLRMQYVPKPLVSPTWIQQPFTDNRSRRAENGRRAVATSDWHADGNGCAVGWRYAGATSATLPSPLPRPRVARFAGFTSMILRFGIFRPDSKRFNCARRDIGRYRA
jgi:hypothetical protein